MNRYSRKIDFKVIKTTLKRRWRFILIVFAPFLLFGVLYSQLAISKIYQSKVVFANYSYLTEEQYDKACIQITKKENIFATIDFLKNEDKPISISFDELASGISIAPYSLSWKEFITISFNNSGKDYVQHILSAFSEISLTELKNNGFANTIVYSLPTKPEKISDDTRFLIWSLLIGVVSSFLFGLIKEIACDEVFDSEDVNKLGCEGFEIKVL